jgi:multicomponent Na+:H+ antiporter subunit F
MMIFWIVSIAKVFLLVAFVLASYRVFRGPTTTDQIIALDLVAAQIIGMVVLFSIDHGQPLYIDLAITIAMISFMSAIALVKYIEKRYL